jgi:hypothetical protein
MRSSLCLVLVLLTVGCQTARTGKPLAKELAGNDADAQVNFWHALTEEPVASNDQAFHGLLLYMDGKDDSTDYAGRVTTLKSRNLLPPGFEDTADAGVRRGTLAVAIMRMIKEKGGVTTRLIGPIPRYAVRELMFINVYPPSTPNQTFTGNEFVGIIGRVEDYQRGNPADAPASALPSEIESSPATPPVRE